MTRPDNKRANTSALLKLAAVLLLGVAAGAAMFMVTLRATPEPAADHQDALGGSDGFQRLLDDMVEIRAVRHAS